MLSVFGLTGTVCHLLEGLLLTAASTQVEDTFISLQSKTNWIRRGMILSLWRQHIQDVFVLTDACMYECCCWPLGSHTAHTWCTWLWEERGDTLTWNWFHWFHRGEGGLTFLLGTEVLVGVSGSLLLLVFGERVGCSIRVLQRPLLTHRLLHLWTLTVTVGKRLLRPVRNGQWDNYIREMFPFDWCSRFFTSVNKSSEACWSYKEK